MTAKKTAAGSVTQPQDGVRVTELGHLAERIQTQLAQLQDLSFRFERVLGTIRGPSEEPEIACAAADPPESVQHTLVRSSERIEMLGDQMSALEALF